MNFFVVMFHKSGDDRWRVGWADSVQESADHSQGGIPLERALDLRSGNFGDDRAGDEHADGDGDHQEDEIFPVHGL